MCLGAVCSATGVRQFDRRCGKAQARRHVCVTFRLAARFCSSFEQSGGGARSRCHTLSPAQSAVVRFATPGRTSPRAATKSVATCCSSWAARTRPAATGGTSLRARRPKKGVRAQRGGRVWRPACPPLRQPRRMDPATACTTIPRAMATLASRRSSRRRTVSRRTGTAVTATRSTAWRRASHGLSRASHGLNRASRGPSRASLPAQPSVVRAEPASRACRRASRLTGRPPRPTR